VNTIKNRIKQLFNKKESRFIEIKTILNSVGYELERVRGSHHIFKHKNGDVIVFPVHGNLIKRCYIKEIIKKINL
jgi:predicted RNA binding protein YcfA (HicA-like mRNA interferase family)